MKKTQPNNKTISAFRLFADGRIDRNELQKRLNTGETTAENYERLINSFKKYGTRPNPKAVCKEFFIWANEWEKKNPKKENKTKERNRKAKYRIEITIWEYM